MQRSTISICGLSTFLLTVFVLQWYPRAHYPLWLWMIIESMFIVSLCLALLKYKKSLTITLCTGSIAIALAMLRVAASIHITGISDIENFAKKEHVTLYGTIVAEPDRRPMQTKYIVEAETIKAENGEQANTRGRVILNEYAGWPKYRYGERISASGILEKPTRIGTFAYDDYLKLSNVHSMMNRAHIQRDATIHAEKTSLIVHTKKKVLSILIHMKEIFEDRINMVYPEPHASLLAGLLTGTRRGIPATLNDIFRTTGITHIIAISGYNITIIMTLVGSLLFWLPLRWRFIPLVCATILFTLFVGASASVVRAAIMGILGLVALHQGREVRTSLLILWTASIMICFHPLELWYDSGFQLSFLAVIGLAIFSEPIKKMLKNVPESCGIRESLTATLAAQVTTLPLSAFLFGQLSLIAPLTNILIAPLIPLAMLFGFVGVMISWLWFPLGQMIAFIGFGCTDLIIFIATTLAQIPYAALSLS